MLLILRPAPRPAGFRRIGTDSAGRSEPVAIRRLVLLVVTPETFCQIPRPRQSGGLGIASGPPIWQPSPLGGDAVPTRASCATASRGSGPGPGRFASNAFRWLPTVSASIGYAAVSAVRPVRDLGGESGWRSIRGLPARSCPYSSAWAPASRAVNCMLWLSATAVRAALAARPARRTERAASTVVPVPAAFEEAMTRAVPRTQAMAAGNAGSDQRGATRV